MDEGIQPNRQVNPYPAPAWGFNGRAIQEGEVYGISMWGTPPPTGFSAPGKQKIPQPLGVRDFPGSALPSCNGNGSDNPLDGTDGVACDDKFFVGGDDIDTIA